MPIITSLGQPERPEEPKTWEQQVKEYRIMRKNTLTRTAIVMTLPMRVLKSALTAAAVR